MKPLVIRKPPDLHPCLLATLTLLLAGGCLACLGTSARPTLEPSPSTPAARRRPIAELPSVVSHTVRAGETLWRITRAYGADIEEVMAVNGLNESALIRDGQVLIIPAPTRLPSPAASGQSLSWPLLGEIRSGFGPRGSRHHDGIDIDGRKGDPIRAAADGEVVEARTWGAYGKTVVVDHGGGVRTLYAHASRLMVSVGDRVRAGEKIAEVGSSGNATGTHLHFEVRQGGRAVDPMPLLRSEAARASAR